MTGPQWTTTRRYPRPATVNDNADKAHKRGIAYVVVASWLLCLAARRHTSHGCGYVHELASERPTERLPIRTRANRSGLLGKTLACRYWRRVKSRGVVFRG